MFHQRRHIVPWAIIAQLLALPAGAQERVEPPEPLEPSARESTPREQELEARLRQLERAFTQLEDRLGAVEEEQEEAAAPAAASMGPVLSGYVDIGAFYVTGDGSGIRPDTGHLVFPEFAGDIPDSWVFMGDPLSTAINARGEPADTRDSRAILLDPVDSRGGFSFIPNVFSLSLLAPLGSPNLTANAMVDFLPRRRSVADPRGIGFGDFIDVRLAYMEYRVGGRAVDVSLAAGKIDSVVGVEYRTQDAPDRLEVTPSLICRYTCGRPVGVRARMRFFEDRALILNLAVTNGAHFVELFPFNSDVGMNPAVTGAGRLSYKLPIGQGIEIGASGALGPQDMQTSSSIVQWHFGFDILADWQNLYFAAEFVQGKAPGDTEAGGRQCGLEPCLRYRGAYGRFGYRVNNWLMPYARVDWRDAVHRDGASFIYISELIRFTAGFHIQPSAQLLVKFEYTANVELGRIPQFPNDIFTSSLVARF